MRSSRTTRPGSSQRSAKRPELSGGHRPAAGCGATLAELLLTARARFAAAGIATPALDARVLISGLLGYEAKDIILQGARQIEPAEIARLEHALGRRLAGEPVYRILGSRPFFGLELQLSAATLEPRPDTEILVEAVAPFVQRRAGEQGICSIADMGTGTGAIGLALLSICADARCVGVDISRDALATAKENARRAGLSDRFVTARSDWFEAISGSFDAIVSNPPYIRSGEIAGLESEVRDHDPHLALDGGPDGLEPYRLLSRGAAAHLSKQGLVAVEHGFDQAGRVEEIFRASGFRPLSRRSDLAGHERVSLFSP